MGIEFEDGTSIDANSWHRMISLVKQRAKEGKSPPSSIVKDGVTIKVKGHAPSKAPVKVSGFPDFIEANHRSWKIRVWKMEDEGMYGCNYFKDENVNYLEFPIEPERDERFVFKLAFSVIDEIEGF